MDLLLIPLFLCVLLIFIAILPSLLLYAVPIRCAIAYVHSEERSRNVITVSWAGMAIRISHDGGISTTKVLIGDHGIYSRSDTDEKSREPEESFTGPDISRGDIARHILPAIRPLGGFAVAVFREVRIGEVRGKVRIGLGDPVSTGMLYGGYWASRFAMNATRIFIEMEPVFDGRVVECDLALHLKLRHPLVILIEALSLMRNPDVRKLMASFRPASTGGIQV
jgi:hypothetical protein